MPENKDNNGLRSRGNGGSRAEYQNFAMLPSSDPATLANSVFELDIYGELNSAKNVAELGKKMLSLVNRLGFSDCCFSRTDIPDLGELVSLPDQLMIDYKKGGFFKYDLVADCANNNSVPIFDSAIQEYVRKAPLDSDMIKQNRERFRLLRSYGYFDGYLIPTRQKKGVENIVFAVHSKGKSPVEFSRKVEKNKAILQVLAEAVDYVTSLKFRDCLWGGGEQVEEIEIRPRPLQLLTVLANEDLTLNEAADELCISIHTANQHIAAAREAFTAHTTNGAICKAIKLGLIKL